MSLAHSAPPSCCAGLRQTLLNGWQQAFPLHPSPFRQMAAQSGATPHELLSTCERLQRSGALEPIRARWGYGLGRERWRLGFEFGGAWSTALAALPGCQRIERVEDASSDSPMPALWAEFEALDEATLQQQLARLPQQAIARLRLPPAPGQVGKPCDDAQLARCVERGLPMCAKPFAECAAQLGRTERQLLSKLHAWQRDGQLQALVLAPPPPRSPQPAVIALWRQLALTPALLERLREWRDARSQIGAQAGLQRVISATPSASWPWRLSLVLQSTQPLALQQLRERLSSIGLPRAPDACATLRIERPRDAALLFQGEG